MPNRWTGGFDAAIELAPSGANALLAALHRKGHRPPGEVQRGPHLMHSLALNLPIPGSTATHGLAGNLQVQLSTPSVSIPPGSPGRVTVSIELYAWFQRTPSSVPAPEFLHGTLSFTTTVALVECDGVPLAEIQVGTADVEVSFTPAAGTTLSDEQRQLVESAVRDVLRDAVGSVHHRIAGVGSGEFAVEHIALRTQRSGALSAFELSLSFGSGSGPAPQPGAPNDLFVRAGEDLALALGREFLTEKLLAAARASLSGIAVSGSRLGVSFNAAPNPSTLAITLQPGIVRASIDGTGALSPGGSFAFRLRQDFGLTTSAGNLSLTLAGGPSLSLTQGNTLLQIVFGIFKGRILDKLETAAAGVVQVASAQLNALVDRSIEDLADALGAPGVSLRLQRATIDADAVMLGAAVNLGATKPAVASFTSVVQPPAATHAFAITKFDALESWIPGGTIRGYRWLQVAAGGAVAGQTDEPHRFVLRIEPLSNTITAGEHYGWPPTSWCLEVRGTQFVGALDPVNVTRTVCAMTVVVPSLDLSALGDLLTLQVVDEAGGVLADLAPWARYRAHAFAGDSENRGYLLVHLAAAEAREAAAILRQALGKLPPATPVFPTIVTKSAGVPARELAGIAITTDPRGAWRARFRLEREGTTVLLGPGGVELWRDTGPLRAEKLLEALKRQDLANARPPRQMPVSLALPSGIIAPDFFFQCTLPVLTQGLSISTTKLLGRELELLFWTTWSAASLEELRRRAAAKARSDGPALILVNDGESPEGAAKFLKQHGFAFEHTATDPARRLASRYGITCWPTLVHLDADHRIQSARFGLEHEHTRVEQGCGTPTRT